MVVIAKQPPPKGWKNSQKNHLGILQVDISAEQRWKQSLFFVQFNVNSPVVSLPLSLYEHVRFLLNTNQKKILLQYRIYPHVYRV